MPAKAFRSLSHRHLLGATAKPSEITLLFCSGSGCGPTPARKFVASSDLLRQSGTNSAYAILARLLIIATAGAGSESEPGSSDGRLFVASRASTLRKARRPRAPSSAVGGTERGALSV